jgi:hypothetical protein
MGWRYLLFTLGGLNILLWAIRFLVFKMFESPRYLIGRGKDAEAIEVLQNIAKYNRTTCSLTVEDLQKAVKEVSGTYSTLSHILSNSSNLGLEHVRGLFATRKLAWSTTLLLALWGLCFGLSSCFFVDFDSGTIGLASTLYNSFLPYM